MLYHPKFSLDRPRSGSSIAGRSAEEDPGNGTVASDGAA